MDALVPIAAVPERRDGLWLLHWAEPCPWCGRTHFHGGGDGPEPSYGSRGVHCASTHKPFRQDCQPEKVFGRKECRVRHAPAQVELVPA